MKPFLAILLAGVLAACSAGTPAIVGTPPPGIAYRLDSNGSTAETDQRAERYCGDHGKHARLQGIDRGSGAPIAEYACD
jgi:hypothetical protein